MFGLATNRSSGTFKKFKGYYLLVEELSGSFKPVMAKEYDRDIDHDHPPWPIIHFDNHSKYTVFAPLSDSITESQDSASGESEAKPENSAASGLVSGSAANLLTRTVSDNPALNSIVNRSAWGSSQKESSQTKRHREDTMESSTKRTKTEEKEIGLPKPGYCENCTMKYDDYKHVHNHSLAH